MPMHFSVIEQEIAIKTAIKMKFITVIIILQILDAQIMKTFQFRDPITHCYACFHTASRSAKSLMRNSYPKLAATFRSSINCKLHRHIGPDFKSRKFTNQKGVQERNIKTLKRAGVRTSWRTPMLQHITTRVMD